MDVYNCQIELAVTIFLISINFLSYTNLRNNLLNKSDTVHILIGKMIAEIFCIIFFSPCSVMKKIFLRTRLLKFSTLNFKFQGQQQQ